MTAVPGTVSQIWRVASMPLIRPSNIEDHDFGTLLAGQVHGLAPGRPPPRLRGIRHAPPAHDEGPSAQRGGHRRSGEGTRQVRAPEEVRRPVPEAERRDLGKKAGFTPRLQRPPQDPASARANRPRTLTDNPPEHVGSCREDLVAHSSIGEENDLGSDRVSFLAIASNPCIRNGRFLGIRDGSPAECPPIRFRPHLGFRNTPPHLGIDLPIG